MREIKFRFFREKPSPKMIYPEADFLVNHLGVPMGIVRYPKGKISICEMDVIPLQYTGLKDKNGKEIYEGDIIDSSMRFCEFGTVKMYHGQWISYVKGKDDILLYDLEGIKVKGNIYENP